MVYKCQPIIFIREASPVHFEETLQPVDSLLDSIGGHNLSHSLTMVKPGGALIRLVGIEPKLVQQKALT